MEELEDIKPQMNTVKTTTPKLLSFQGENMAKKLFKATKTESVCFQNIQNS